MYVGTPHKCSNLFALFHALGGGNVLVSAAVWCHDPCLQQGPDWLHHSSVGAAASAQSHTQEGETPTRFAPDFSNVCEY